MIVQVTVQDVIHKKLVAHVVKKEWSLYYKILRCSILKD